MLPLKGFHALAAARGDGLRPEFLALSNRIEAITTVTDLARMRGDQHIQAGPNPPRPAGAALPRGILHFAQPSKTATTGITRRLDTQSERNA